MTGGHQRGHDDLGNRMISGGASSLWGEEPKLVRSGVRGKLEDALHADATAPGRPHKIDDEGLRERAQWRPGIPAANHRPSSTNCLNATADELMRVDGCQLLETSPRSVARPCDALGVAVEQEADDRAAMSHVHTRRPGIRCQPQRSRKLWLWQYGLMGH